MIASENALTNTQVFRLVFEKTSFIWKIMHQEMNIKLHAYIHLNPDTINYKSIFYVILY